MSDTSPLSCLGLIRGIQPFPEWNITPVEPVVHRFTYFLYTACAHLRYLFGHYHPIV